MKKDSSIFIKHILESMDNIEDFVRGISKDFFIKNKEKHSAVIRQIEIIGEAVKNLPDQLKNKHPNVPWNKIAGMRDKLMHHYFGVDLETVWKVVEDDLPRLKEQIEMIIKEYNKKFDYK